MKKVVLMLFLLGTVGATGAFADVFTLAGTGDFGGQGFGTLYTLLSLQNTPSETGAVAPTYAANLSSLGSIFGTCGEHSGIEVCGNATYQSHVITNTDLNTLGFTSSSIFQLLYNPNQIGKSTGDSTSMTGGIPTTLDPAFTVYFYGSAGNVLFTGTYAGRPEPFPQVESNGQGNSGYLFSMSGGQFASNFSDIAAIGMSGTVTGSNDGQEDWSVGRIASPIPEPATFGLIGAGLVVLGDLFRRRLRNRG